MKVEVQGNTMSSYHNLLEDISCRQSERSGKARRGKAAAGIMSWGDMSIDIVRLLSLIK